MTRQIKQTTEFGLLRLAMIHPYEQASVLLLSPKP